MVFQRKRYLLGYDKTCNMVEKPRRFRGLSHGTMALALMVLLAPVFPVAYWFTEGLAPVFAGFEGPNILVATAVLSWLFFQKFPI